MPTTKTLFERNLEASQLILAGEPDSAKQVLSRFTADELITSMNACKVLLKTENMLSQPQKMCLRCKLDIMKELLAKL